MAAVGSGAASRGPCAPALPTGTGPPAAPRPLVTAEIVPGTAASGGEGHLGSLGRGESWEKPWPRSRVWNGKFGRSVSVQSFASRTYISAPTLELGFSLDSAVLLEGRGGSDRLLEMVEVSCPFVLPHCFSLAFGLVRLDVVL